MNDRRCSQEGPDDRQSLAVREYGCDERSEEHEDAIQLGGEANEGEHVPADYY